MDPSLLFADAAAVVRDVDAVVVLPVPVLVLLPALLVLLAGWPVPRTRLVLATGRSSSSSELRSIISVGRLLLRDAPPLFLPLLLLLLPAAVRPLPPLPEALRLVPPVVPLVEPRLVESTEPGMVRDCQMKVVAGRDRCVGYRYRCWLLLLVAAAV